MSKKPTTKPKLKQKEPQPPQPSTPEAPPQEQAQEAQEATVASPVSDDPRMPSHETPVESIPVIEDVKHNPCVRHGDTSGGNRRYVLAVAKVREPFGVCNPCWAYYNAVQAWKTTNPEEAAKKTRPPMTAAERARRGRF